jgi:cell division protein FtsI (penicillin-binding protein 3)
VENSKADKSMKFRVYAMYFVLVFFGVAIFARLINIQFYQGEELREMDHKMHVKEFTIDAARGNIYSSDGSLLATSVPIFELRMDPLSDPISEEKFYSEIDELSRSLSSTFKDLSPTEYRQKIVQARKDTNRYLLLKKGVDYPTLKLVREFPIFREGKYKGGLIVNQSDRREFPFRELALRTVGYYKIEQYRDSITKELKERILTIGVEGAYNDYLEGVKGKRLMQKIAGNVWKPMDSEHEIEPQHGADVVASLDMSIQDVAHHALVKQLIAQDAHHGCAVLMEVSTGRIKAIVNLSRIGPGRYAEIINYAIWESTEPGSTFKLPSLMAAIEDGYTNLDEMVDTENGTKRFHNYTMKDSHEGGYGTISLQKVFEKSSNVGTSKIIVKHYAKQPQKFIDRLYSFGLHKPLGLEIQGESMPEIKDTKSKLWSGLSLPLMSIGYETKITPLQLLTFYNAIANNGVMVKPQFVSEIRKLGKTVVTFEPEIINPAICSPSTLEMARAMLEGVVKEGTATNLRSAPYQIAAKTGTAQIAQGSSGYKTEKIKYQASLCGYFPAQNPLYSCIVVVNSPSNRAIYGNEVAGPVFREIADKVYSMSTKFHKPIEKDTASVIQPLPFVKSGLYKEVNKLANTLRLPVQKEADANYVQLHPDNRILNVNDLQTPMDKVPSVVGMGLKNALALLENRKMNVRVIGKGVVRRQSLKPGTAIESNQEIIIELS